METLTRILKKKHLMFITTGKDHMHHCEYICYHGLLLIACNNILFELAIIE